MTVEATLLAAAVPFVAGLIVLYGVLVRLAGPRRRLEERLARWARTDRAR